MKIHEYQAKELFRRYGIPTQAGEVAETPEQAAAIARNYGHTVVVKAQVHAGGRGKAGGVKLAKTPEEAAEKARGILGMDIKGSRVRKVLIADAVEIAREAYLAVILDRSARGILFMASAEGGMEIEELAKTSPEKIFRFHAFSRDFPEAAALPVSERLFGPAHQAVVLDIMRKLFRMFVELDASLVEINPLVLTPDGTVVAVDGKVNFDDNALFRHPDIEALRDLGEENPNEVDAKACGLSYVELDGDIGCMVNGAGLAMATMDMIKLFGGRPANFLDVGGSSNPDKVVNAFRIILSRPGIKAVLINIFGGITRCDDIAKGILEAFSRMTIRVPVVVRLTGTNAEAGLAMLRESALIPAATFAEAVRKVIEAAGGPEVNSDEHSD
ncbi:MAG: ADP-forming succinate--CoA ligase subunit beta [Kiritimatiellae bacterium]|nr:ADP-forming succinate--CoA ligase subunit beta [Kiritimatiellia bacterium]MDW8458625.1 ADP-forming succinate--CoA ligase subunit beta [Verrucomicrobiota bacterium]